MDRGSIFVILESEKMWKKVDKTYLKSFYKDKIFGVHFFWLFLIPMLDYTSSAALGYRAMI